MPLSWVYPIIGTVPVLTLILALVALVGLFSKDVQRQQRAMEMLRIFVRIKDIPKPADDEAGETKAVPGLIEQTYHPRMVDSSRYDKPPIYTVCPGCRHLTPNAHVLYTPRGDDSLRGLERIDWREDVLVMCTNCRHQYLVRYDSLQPSNACSTCFECRRGFEHPGAAVLVRCTFCGWLGAPRLMSWTNRYRAQVASQWPAFGGEVAKPHDPWSDLVHGQD